MTQEQDHERKALNDALLAWSESLSRDDLEGDPRDVTRSAALAMWKAGRDYALSRDRAPGEAVTRALERIADEFHFQHIIRDDAWKTTAVPVPSRVQCPQKFCTLATVALAARPEGA